MQAIENTDINIKLDEFIDTLNSIDKKLLVDFPIIEYYKSIKAIPPTNSYAFIPKEVRNKIARLTLSYGQETAALYQKAILVFLIKNSLPLFQDDRLSADVKYLYKQRFELIFEDFDSQDSSYYDYNNDLFLKDLNTCSLKLFPAGAQLVQLSLLNWYFILRSIRYGGLNQGSFSKCINASLFYLTEIKRGIPFYEKHLDIRWLNEFTQKGWCNFYLRMAEMLKLNPHVQGLFGVSWFYDPCLENISPGLLYLRKIPERSGAKTFKFGTTQSDIDHAITASSRRKKLYEEGSYMPTAYVLIWLRDDLIKWAGEYRLGE